MSNRDSIFRINRSQRICWFLYSFLSVSRTLNPRYVAHASRSVALLALILSRFALYEAVKLYELSTFLLAGSALLSRFPSTNFFASSLADFPLAIILQVVYMIGKCLQTQSIYVWVQQHTKSQHGLPWFERDLTAITPWAIAVFVVCWTWAWLTVNWKIWVTALEIIFELFGRISLGIFEKPLETFKREKKRNLAVDTVPSTSAQLVCLTWLEIFCDRHCYTGVTAVYIVTPQIICYIVVLKVLKLFNVRGACHGVRLSTIVKFRGCLQQSRHNYRNMFNEVSKRGHMMMNLY